MSLSDPADQTLDLPAAKLQRKSAITPKSDDASDTRFPPKKLADKYVFVGELGSGSMGQVCVYHEEGIDRDVAIKFQRGSDRALASRFHAEARIAASLQHPNVVTVLASGEYEGTPYIVFEHLDGKSLDRLDDALPWTEVRKLGLQLASGLAAVHRAGLLHRDIKPANAMLLSKRGDRIVKLIDFGVAKESDAANRYGGATGTPRYMAPEVWDNASPTEKSDVYSLGLTLYQLCTGTKPPIHPYDEDIRIDRPEIDSAFASVVNRCLERNPAKRYASGAELYNALLPLYSVKELLDIDVQQWKRNDRADVYLWAGRKLMRVANLELGNLPDDHREFLRISRHRVDSIKRRKRVLAGLMVLLVVGVYIGIQYAASAAVDAKVSEHMKEARSHLQKATRIHEQFDNERRQVLKAFRQGNAEASKLWQRMLSLESQIAKGYSSAGKKLEVALELDSGRKDVRELLANVLESRARLANTTHRERERDEHLDRLSVYSEQAYLAWIAPTDISVTTQPVSQRVSIEEFRTQDDGNYKPEPRVGQLTTPFTTKLEPGSYALVFHAQDDYPEVRYPFLVPHRPEPIAISLERPASRQVPDGFVPILAGSFYYGFGSHLDDEHQRLWYITQPLHTMTLGSYAIARHETTYAEWLTFLQSACKQPGCTDRPDLIPASKYDVLTISVTWDSEAQKWRFTYDNGRKSSDTALEGELLVYGSREQYLVKQNWLRFPVSGISPGFIREYLIWLHDTKRVPNARLCTEYEWERAARGADTRTFPHGHVMAPHQANFDATHEGLPTALGPDEVGAHDESISPFGVHDMAGNVWELTGPLASLKNANKQPAGNMLRGGSFYQNYASAKSVNRTKTTLERSLLNGLRICTDIANR